MGFEKDDISSALFASDGDAEKTLDMLIAFNNVGDRNDLALRFEYHRSKLRLLSWQDGVMVAHLCPDKAAQVRSLILSFHLTPRSLQKFKLNC